MWDSLDYAAQEYSLPEPWQTGAGQSWGKAMRVQYPAQLSCHWSMQDTSNPMIQVNSHAAFSKWNLPWGLGLVSFPQGFEIVTVFWQSALWRALFRFPVRVFRAVFKSHSPQAWNWYLHSAAAREKRQNLKHNDWDWAWKQKCCEPNRIPQAAGAYRKKDVQLKKRIPRKL